MRRPKVQGIQVPPIGDEKEPAPCPLCGERTCDMQHRFTVNMPAFREAALRAADGAPFELPAGDAIASKIGRRWRVEMRKVKARPLITIAADAPVWSRCTSVEGDFAGCADALVRLFPPYDATKEAIKELRTHVERCGAAQVVVMPRAASPKVVLTDKRAQMPTLDGPASIRKTVEGMIADANLSDGVQREELAAFVDECLTEGGL